MELRYGTNPHQRARVLTAEPLPLRVLSGEPSYVNLLDALNAWSLVQELQTATGEVAATSFKHVSPAGAALADPLDPLMSSTWCVPAPDPVTTAYVRARDADPKSSFGDMIAVSASVTRGLADFLSTVVSDGIIAPSYDEGTLGLLAAKKRGTFLTLQVDPSWQPLGSERRTVFGIELEQDRDCEPIAPASWTLPGGGLLPAAQERDALVASVTLRHTQSNSVLFAKEGMCLGIGAGQQSRIDCTRLAGSKTALWWMRRHPQLMAPAHAGRHDRDALARQIRAAEECLDPSWASADPQYGPAADVRAWLAESSGVTAASDGFIPFVDNVEEMARYGVTTLVEPGGSMRTSEVAAACLAHGITLVHTNQRLFHH